MHTLIVSPEIVHTERDEVASLSTNLFPSLMILCCYGRQRFCANNPDILTKTIEKAPFDHLC